MNSRNRKKQRHRQGNGCQGNKTKTHALFPIPLTSIPLTSTFVSPRLRMTKWQGNVWQRNGELDFIPLPIIPLPNCFRPAFRQQPKQGQGNVGQGNTPERWRSAAFMPLQRRETSGNRARQAVRKLKRRERRAPSALERFFNCSDSDMTGVPIPLTFIPLTSAPVPLSQRVTAACAPSPFLPFPLSPLRPDRSSVTPRLT